jgi:two-component system phosphate regulon response regulator PhoB
MEVWKRLVSVHDSAQVLVVDPDPEWRERIVHALEGQPFRCRGVSSGRAALEVVTSGRPHLILLDTLLPDISGLGLCRSLRELPAGGRIGIVMVTAQSSEIDRILAFEAGADDFLSKPFHPRELCARVAAVLRGFGSLSEDAGMPAGDRGSLELNRAAGRAAVHGRKLDLTPKEFEILVALAERPGRVMRREQLVERVWGANAPKSERAIDAHIKSIRRKLGDADGCIDTVRGVGYRFAERPRG